MMIGQGLVGNWKKENKCFQTFRTNYKEITAAGS
jgi:hypothetical protein